jgi:hypothetical protein
MTISAAIGEIRRVARGLFDDGTGLRLWKLKREGVRAQSREKERRRAEHGWWSGWRSAVHCGDIIQAWCERARFVSAAAAGGGGGGGGGVLSTNTLHSLS